MNILAIETSCDETAIARIRVEKNSSSISSVEVFSNLVSSQSALHATWGGVVPNLAKREHQRILVPLFLQALHESAWRKVSKTLHYKRYTPASPAGRLNAILEREPELLKQFERHVVPLEKPNIDLIAVTQGPGLEPALWVGVNFARALSALWKIPLVGINHMEGHIFSALLKEEQKRIPNSKFLISNKISKTKSLNAKRYTLNAIPYPAIALLVSGGHTELVVMKKSLKYEIIGETRDDAAGEAFDKVARLLGLGYPGGPEIAREAAILSSSQSGNDIMLPRPMINSKNFDFSFSGLKTAVLYLVRDLEKQGVNIKKLRPAIAGEFQDAVVDVLVTKTIQAAKQYKAKTIILGGGVAANKELRTQLCKKLQEELPKTNCLLPDTSLTGDNALMIALSAIAHAKQARKTTWKTLQPDARMRLGK